MKYFMDKKSWAFATVESFGILAFNAAFGSDIYSMIGSEVPTAHVVFFSTITFFLRIIWFYGNMVARLFLEQRKK